MYVGSYCPGCGGGDGNQSCAIARCSRAHGDVPYCFQCREYPCARYEGLDAYDSFLPCRGRAFDMARAAEMGVEAYTAALREKMDALRVLLARCNDGRHKSFFLTAVYLLPLDDIISVLERLPASDAPAKERAAAAEALFRAAAAERGVDLKLRKKPRKA